VIKRWRRLCNTRRPHGSFGYRPPAWEVFSPRSARAACATPTCFAAPAGVAATHTLTFNMDHSLGADQDVLGFPTQQDHRSSLQSKDRVLNHTRDLTVKQPDSLMQELKCITFSIGSRAVSAQISSPQGQPP
jgi:hypothetical protein